MTHLYLIWLMIDLAVTNFLLGKDILDWSSNFPHLVVLLHQIFIAEDICLQEFLISIITYSMRCAIDRRLWLKHALIPIVPLRNYMTLSDDFAAEFWVNGKVVLMTLGFETIVDGRRYGVKVRIRSSGRPINCIRTIVRHKIILALMVLPVENWLLNCQLYLFVEVGRLV